MSAAFVRTDAPVDSTFKLAWVGFILLLVGIAYGLIYFSGRRREREMMMISDPVEARSAPAPENDLVFIPTGEFLRGNNDGLADEQPERKIFLDGFYINRYEVMFAEYSAFVAATGRRSPASRYIKNFSDFASPAKPVVHVTWDDADSFCRWKGMRLPTEAQWEKAARGSDGRKWPWGSEMAERVGNFKGAEDRYHYTSPVGFFPQDQSPYGLFDMAGNGQEWIADWYQEDYYRREEIRNPEGPATGEEKVLRGGSWNDSPVAGRTTARMKMLPDYRDTTIGFRCAKSAEGDGVTAGPARRGPEKGRSKG